MRPRFVLRRAPIVLALAILAFAASCSDDDDPVRPTDEGFSLEVRVATPSGDPVEDLEVVVWNMSSSLQTHLQESSFFRRRARTDVHFQLASAARCSMVVSDVAGRVVHTPLVDQEHQAGVYEYVLGVGVDYRAGVELFRYELVVRDPQTSAMRLRDARWMTAVHLDRSRLTLERTDADGRVRFDDPRFAPGLVVNESMDAVDESGQVRGSFTIGDSLAVRAYDGDGNWVQEWVAIDDAPNSVALEWDVARLRRGPGFAVGAAPALGRDAELPPVEDALGRNVPNPFN